MTILKMQVACSSESMEATYADIPENHNPSICAASHARVMRSEIFTVIKIHTVIFWVMTQLVGRQAQTYLRNIFPAVS